MYKKSKTAWNVSIMQTFDAALKDSVRWTHTRLNLILFEMRTTKAFLSKVFRRTVK